MSSTPARSDPEASLQSVEWFRTFAPPVHSARSALLGPAIALVVGLVLFFLLHHPILGGIVIAVALLIGIVSFGSPRAKARIDRLFARLGAWIAAAVSWLLLTPTFLIGFTLVRGWMWLVGSDPMQMSRKQSGDASYWLQSDSQKRKVRYARAMFATERLQPRGFGLKAILALLIVALVLSEAFLRLWGYGDPVLYAEDAQIGYYPAPNQLSTRWGGRIEINAFGMRSPNYAAVKTPGTFRVLMIGDSTLYGGSYVGQEQLYSTLLEQHLRALAPGRRIEVMAISANAWGPFNELGYIRRFGTFGADLVMVDLPTADLYRPLVTLAETPFLGNYSPPRLALQEVAMNLVWRYRGDQIGPGTPADRAWSRTQGLQAYGELARLLRASGAEVEFHVLPIRPSGTGMTAGEEQAVADERRDVPDLARAISGSAEVDYPIGLFRRLGGRAYHDGVHLEPPGHGDYARYLSAYVAAHSQAWRSWLTQGRAPASVPATAAGSRR